MDTDSESRPPGRRPLMADVAKAAGVHITTVSRALRNSPLLPAATRNRIQRVARGLGYRLDPHLAGLAEYRRRERKESIVECVAYVSSWGRDETDADTWRVPEQTPFYREAKTVLEYCGYKLLHVSLRQPGMTPRAISRILRERGVRGVIVGGFSHPLRRLEMDWRHFCAVRADFNPEWPGLHSVGNHQFQIMQLAFEKIRAAGHRRIGFSLTATMDDDARHAYSSSFVYQQLAVAPEDRVPLNLHPWDAASEFLAWYRKHRPEVVIGTLHEWRWLLQAGHRVPEDVAFASIYRNAQDDTVAGVMHETGYCGRRAAEMLISQLQHNSYGVPAIPTITLAPGRWCPGPSLPVRRKRGKWDALKDETRRGLG